jgi:hypothetical protein
MRDLVLCFWCYSSQSKLSREKDVHFYVWTEDCGGKGANEIISCLCHLLMNCLPDTVKHVRLGSVRCTSQNKNFIHMLFFQSLCKMFSTEVTQTYPLLEHSDLPVDRCFGRVEEDLAKCETILIVEDSHLHTHHCENLKSHNPYSK